jgi:hypothetical protein
LTKTNLKCDPAQLIICIGKCPDLRVGKGNKLKGKMNASRLRGKYYNMPVDDDANRGRNFAP